MGYLNALYGGYKKIIKRLIHFSPPIKCLMKMFFLALNIMHWYTISYTGHYTLVSTTIEIESLSVLPIFLSQYFVSDFLNGLFMHV